MLVSDYDKTNLRKILNEGLGDWFAADLLRFLNKVLSKVDGENLEKLLRTYPEECKIIYRYWGWKEGEIDTMLFWAGVM